MTCQKEITVVSDPAQMAFRAAGIFKSNAVERCRTTGLFTTALSGGSTPVAMHRMLASEPFRDSIPWKSTHIFWVDDRCVPYTDSASNYGAAQDDFLSTVPIPPANVHPMPGNMAPGGDGSQEMAMVYEKEISRFFRLNAGAFPVFDLVFLGIGTDGHTASLFPGDGALDEQEKLIVQVKGGNPDLYRLTMTFPVLNQARNIVFLVSGKGKAPMAKALIEDTGTRFPAGRVEPVTGRLAWLLDREAGSLLSSRQK
jgi:6-phosphogluconolactonase